MSQSCSFTDIGCHFSWIKGQMEAFGVWLIDSVLSSIASVFESIDAPDFLSNAASVAPISSTVSWAAQPFNLEFGMGIIVTAYIARFILKRIPGIG